MSYPLPFFLVNKQGRAWYGYVSSKPRFLCSTRSSSLCCHSFRSIDSLLFYALCFILVVTISVVRAPYRLRFVSPYLIEASTHLSVAFFPSSTSVIAGYDTSIGLPLDFPSTRHWFNSSSSWMILPIRLRPSSTVEWKKEAFPTD